MTVNLKEKHKADRIENGPVWFGDERRKHGGNSGRVSLKRWSKYALPSAQHFRGWRSDRRSSRGLRSRSLSTDDRKRSLSPQMPGRLDTAEQDRGRVRELRPKALINGRASPAGGDREDP